MFQVLASILEMAFPFARDASRGSLHASIFFSGGNAGGVTPVPISNTEVKSSWADGTAGATLWESRSLPELF